MRSAASLLAANSWLADIFAKTLATSTRLVTTAKLARPTIENASRSVIVDTIRAIIDAVSPTTIESYAYSTSRGIKLVALTPSTVNSAPSSVVLT